MPRPKEPISVMSKETAAHMNRVVGRRAFRSIHDDDHPFSRRNLAHLCGFVGMSTGDTAKFLADTDEIRNRDDSDAAGQKGE